MPVQLIRADALYSGAPYAYAAMAPAGSLVFTAGACPIGADGTVTAPGDYVAQAELAMSNLVAALAAWSKTAAELYLENLAFATTTRGSPPFGAEMLRLT